MRIQKFQKNLIQLILAIFLGIFGKCYENFKYFILFFLEKGKNPGEIISYMTFCQRLIVDKVCEAEL